MFDDQKTDQTTNLDNGMPDTDAGSAPAMGIGVNPNPAFVPPSDGATPTVVLPPQATNAISQHGPAAGVVPPSDDTAASTPLSAPVAPSGELEEIKRQALAQLSPLVNKLEQTPEEKYKTIMMMIQASDNQDLINEAYENAQKITDEKAKAEALLNIVNEINYFAQKSQS